MPARERAGRARLFDALEATLPVRFVAFDPGRDDFDAVVALPGARDVPDRLPCLVAVSDESPTAPIGGIGQPESSDGDELRLATGAPLDARLRGLRLREEALAGPTALTAAGGVVLAARGDDPLWVARGTHVTVAIAPAELEEDESLRERIRDGRFLALTALMHFVRTACAPVGWVAPPLRACFLFDDPNLHRPTYGHVRYRELVAEADRHDYHVAFAHIPLDSWFAHGRTARLFRERADRLSLAVHGNDHTRQELAQPWSAIARQALLSQAIRRVIALERRTGVSVGRVMVAPHGACSREIARDLITVGFEALCISRPYPWLARPPYHWLTRPPGSSPLAGAEPASIVENGLPVLLRRPIGQADADLPLRAFLDQPLILYGHHGDLAGGLDRLSELAAVIHGLGDVQWMSLADIATSNVTTSFDEETLRVRMFARRVRVKVPPDAKWLVVDGPTPDPQLDEVRCDGGRAASPSEPIAVPHGAGELEVQLVRAGAISPHAIPPPGMRYWPVTRRLAAETRDRLTPLYQTVRQVRWRAG